MSRQLTLPSNRLCAAAEIAAASLYDGETKNLKAVDVGCDHAKLAIYLIQSGICTHVTACDITEGPVQVARNNVSRRTFKDKPLSDYIDVVCTDGLAGLENTDANRIFILGMGGELIAGILERASFVRDDAHKGKIKFILQPMTSENELRVYLYTNGYEITDEVMVLDKDRVYAVMSVVYDGVKRQGTRAEMLLGKHNIKKGTELFERQLTRRIRITEKAISQRQSNGMESLELLELLEEMKKIEENLKCTVSQ